MCIAIERRTSKQSQARRTTLRKATDMSIKHCSAVKNEVYYEEVSQSTRTPAVGHGSIESAINVWEDTRLPDFPNIRIRF